jgi:hypothetical protein
MVNEDDWQLESAIHEVCEVRMDIQTLMQPRPFVPSGKGQAPRQQQNQGKGRQSEREDRDLDRKEAPGDDKRGKGKKGKGKGKKGEKGDKGGKLDIPKNWAKKVDGLEPCARHHLGLCHFGARCKYSHFCPNLTPNGRPCGKDHKARNCQYAKSPSG